MSGLYHLYDGRRRYHVSEAFVNVDYCENGKETAPENRGRAVICFIAMSGDLPTPSARAIALWESGAAIEPARLQNRGALSSGPPAESGEPLSSRLAYSEST